MSSKHKQQLKIYAIIHEGNVFVGKTKGELGPIIYQHRRAQNSFTAQYFYPKNSKKPSMHVLEHILCSCSDSYRHIVAWVRIFQDAGYQIINPRGTVEDANDLHPQTIELVNQLRPFSLDIFLNNTQYMKNPKSAPVSSAPKPPQMKKGTGREKITLRVTPEEKELFISYAKSLELTQSQTLQYLVRKIHLEEANFLSPTLDNDTFIYNLQKSHMQEIESLKKEIHELRIALRIRSEERADQSKKLNQCCAIAKKAILAFYSLFDSTAVIPLDIERGKYKDYISTLPDNMVYAYPAQSGTTLLRLQAVLIGDGTAPARFILGVDQNGQLIKLRYYPSIYFWGISPGNERFSQRNSVWYMAWKKTGDVAELVAAYPIQIKAKYQNPMDKREITNKWFDEIVAESEELDKSLL